MKKILLVEDDKFLVRVYKTKLEKLGYETSFLEDGTDALETTKKEKPAVIVLDIMLPQKNGYEVIKALRSDSETKNIPILALSQLEMDEDVKEILDLGATEFLKKTELSFSDVVDVIQKYLG